MRQRPVAATEANLQNVMEEALRANREQFSTMLNARLEGLEGRLLPEPRLRPPLAADRRRVAQAAAVAAAGKEAPAASHATEGVEASAAKPAAVRPKRPKRSMAAQEAAARRVAPQSSAEPAATPATWSAVVARNRPKKAEKTGAKPAAAKPTSSGATKKVPVRRKLRPPRTAAITLTLKPGAEEKGWSYEKALALAKSRISLREVGLTAVRFRTAATGARMLEVPPGTNEAEKAADALAEKLREALSPEIVQIHRPTKCVELRVLDLDDSVTVAEAVAAVAEQGGCPTGAIKAGIIARGSSGSGSLWLSCPVSAAKKVVEVGRIRVGWVSARVMLLDPRPLHCFRCLERGHMGAKCDRDVDRSRLCFRCGQPGHKARECSAAVASCVVCTAAGKPAAHAACSKSCQGGKGAAQREKTRKVATKGPVAASPRTEAEPMETTQ
ncbi:uncharacterized protein LOC126781464 [Nymphalis io]|uniref:uncharacterized protein LOC126781464 n=1 Tax=Inachis io TaxID=171585 RepID=UPI00216A2629|nr:uncharacterized protein LOC126781464 [Nymphalis io]